jgi:hypothetical protein
MAVVAAAARSEPIGVADVIQTGFIVDRGRAAGKRNGPFDQSQPRIVDRQLRPAGPEDELLVRGGAGAEFNHAVVCVVSGGGAVHTDGLVERIPGKRRRSAGELIAVCIIGGCRAATGNLVGDRTIGCRVSRARSAGGYGLIDVAEGIVREVLRPGGAAAVGGRNPAKVVGRVGDSGFHLNPTIA